MTKPSDLEKIRRDTKTSLEDYQSQTGDRISKKLIRDVVNDFGESFSKKERKELVEDLFNVLS